MNRRTAIKTAVAGFLASGFARSQSASSDPIPRYRQRSNRYWKFLHGDPPGAEQLSFDDSSWQSVSLPHDWSVAGVFDPSNPSSFWGGFATGGAGWYRLAFTPPDLGSRRRLLVEFEGVYKNSQVFLNGQPLGTRPNGFASFEYDLTPYLIFGKANILAVRAESGREPGLRWYAGCGIYRNVWMTIADQCRVGWKGTAITTPSASPSQATVRVTTTVVNQGSSDADVRVSTQIFDKDGQGVGQSISSLTVPAGSSSDATQEIHVPFPSLWSPQNPDLYATLTRVFQDGVQVDDYVSLFGIRTIRFDDTNGFLLNEQSVKLRGVCLHQDFGCLGTAAHDKAIERRLTVLRSLGCNAIRTAHNPPAPYFLDVCDRMGFLVIDEAFDKWTGDWEDGDFGSPGFADWWQEDLRTMIVRDRNHPSVIVWSVGNETGAPGEPEHDATLKQLADFARDVDPTRPVTCALRPQVDVPLEEFAAAVARSAAYMDVLAINYQEQYYDLYRDKVPQAMISSEAYPFFRGSPERFTTDNSWWDTASRGFAAGQFVWSGFDYLGESAGWPSKGWPNGLIDTAGFVKARAAFHATVWSDKPTVGMYVISDSIDIDPGLPAWRWPNSAAHWNFAAVTGQPVLVVAVSNCETVELYVNGQSFGEQKTADVLNWSPSWPVWFTPGAIEAVGRNGGKIVAQLAFQTAGNPSVISVKPERLQLAADGLEVCHIEVSLLDDAGIIVPDQDRLIEFSVTGPARVIATDNGDLRSSEPYSGSTRTTKNGRALAVIQSTGEKGDVTFTARSGDLPAAAVTLNAA